MMDKIDKFDGEWRVLSNFYYCEFEYDGEVYNTSEHAYQAMKFTTAKDRLMIRSAVTPSLAKRYANKDLRQNIRHDWSTVKDGIMYTVLQAKFKTNEYCRAKLLSTGNAEIIEGNTWGDKYWGVCNGEGQNRLGKLLMRIRSELRKQETIDNLFE